MRNPFRLTALAFAAFLAIGATAKSRVVTSPVYTARNTTSIEVTKVELTDTATILHIHAIYRPKNWIRMAEGSRIVDNNGRVYRWRWGKGIVPGRELWMPESGQADFQMGFEPVDAKATAIDLDEGNREEGNFCIWGIQLKGNRLPKLQLPEGFADTKPDLKTPLAEPVMRYGVGRLKVRLLDFQPGMENIQAQIVPGSDLVLLPENQRAVTIAADGTFEKEIPMAYTSEVRIFISGLTHGWCRVWLSPGETTEVAVNVREMCRKASPLHENGKPYGCPLYVKGPMAALAQELAAQSDALDKLSDRLDSKNIVSMDLAQFKAAANEWAAEVKAGLQKFKLSAATKEYLEMSVALEQLGRLRMAPYDIASAMAIGNRQLPDSVWRSRQTELYRQQTTDYVETEEAVRLADTPKALLLSQYDNLFGVNSLMFDCHNGTRKGQLADNFKAWRLLKSVQDELTPIDDSNRQQLDALPENYRQLIMEANRRTLTVIEANRKKTGYRVCDVPQGVAPEALFDSITAAYRGKVVLVDLWQTWCGPCRHGHKEMKPLKEELAGQNIAFVYLCSESSPKGAFANMAPDITGDHYRFGRTQWDALCKRFGVQGVPTYLILNPKGEVVYTHTGFPGVSAMRKQLMKAMGK